MQDIFVDKVCVLNHVKFNIRAALWSKIVMKINAS